MKKPILILIGGAPGVGKSTVAELLYQRLNNSVWLDGDDLWRMHPFTVNTTTKQMVLDNIGFVLSKFLKGPFEYVIFSWVMHEHEIVEAILSRLTEQEYDLLHFTLGCADEVLRQRIAVAATPRNAQVCMDRLASTRQNYPDLIDTTDLSPEDMVNLIIAQLAGKTQR